MSLARSATSLTRSRQYGHLLNKTYVLSFFVARSLAFQSGRTLRERPWSSRLGVGRGGNDPISEKATVIETEVKQNRTVLLLTTFGTKQNQDWVLECKDPERKQQIKTCDKRDEYS
jgi:hypothetical protein